MTVSVGVALGAITLSVGLLTAMRMGERFIRWRGFRRQLQRLGGLRGGLTLPRKFVVPRRKTAPRTVPSEDDLALMAVEVSSRLRAGSPVSEAWQQTWGRYATGPFSGADLTGAPDDLVQFLDGQRNLPGWARWFPGRSGQASSEQVGAINALVVACRFSFLTGAPLAEVLDQVSESIAQTTRARRAQNQAFTGPKLSARVLTALPVVAIFGGELVGAGSLGWLFGGGIGTLCAAAGAMFLIAGHGSSRRMIDVAHKDAQDEIEAAMLCDLARAGLQSGAAIPAVLTSLGKAQQEQGLERVAHELVMGSDWQQAWHPLPMQAEILFRGLQPGWEEGVSPVALLQRMTRQIRERRVSQAEEDAAKLAVKLVIPLGIFLLPAFILWGIVPVIFALIGGQLGL